MQPADQSIYEDKTTNRNYYQPRTMTDFYYTKWTGYKKPDWYHPYNGRDVRSEYLYRRKLHERGLNIPPWLDIAIEYMDVNRLFFYLLLFFIGDIIRVIRNYKAKMRQEMELQLLKNSFQFEDPSKAMLQIIKDIDSNQEDSMEIECKDDFLKLALNDYINERLTAISQEYTQDTPSSS